MARPTPAADLVLRRGRIWTGAARAPEAQAVASLRGTIAAVGSDADVAAWIGPRTEVVDLEGRRVVPGFHDAHVHFAHGGRSLTEVDLRDARSPEELRERLRAHAARTPPGAWITGGRWDHENWTPASLPTRQLIDEATPANPVFVSRLDGHMALANTRALALAGVTRDAPDPEGGAIVRDARGEPTGILKDTAMDALYGALPERSADETADALRAAMRHAASLGVTSVADMSASPAVVRAYQRLLAEGALTVRVSCHQPLTGWSSLAAVGLAAGFGGDRLRVGALKGFSDGSLGSTTALFFEPYADAPETAGLPGEDMIPPEKLRTNVQGADAAGLQVAVHAIGDRANAAVLDVFEAVAQANGPRDRRFRVEHAQHLRPADVPRFAALGVIASMQPYHLIDDGRWAEGRIGPGRAAGAYAFRGLLDAGTVLAFGSDWPVAPLDPLAGIYAAVTRRTLGGAHPNGWVPEQKISVEEALRAYTGGGVYASFREDSTGSIEVGKRADLAVLTDDVFEVDPIRLLDVRVALTVFDGCVVYERVPARV